MEKKYTLSFFAVASFIVVTLFFLVTWMNPERITPAPWSIDFVSDRNMSLSKFSLLKDNLAYTDLIVGSSTSEVVLPEMIENLYGVKSYLGGTGGSKTPYKYAQINYALNKNPNIKRIIYVVDLFEFVNTDLDTKVYYQPEIMENIEPALRGKLKNPDWISRVQDYFSESSIKSAFKTLNDYKKFKKNNYISQFRSDGTTGRSMVLFDHKEEIAPRVLRIAKGYESQYKNLKELDPVAIEFFHEIAKTAKNSKIQISFVIAPFHSLFYKHFEADFKKHNDVYNKYVEFIKSLESPEIQVVDFSYPRSIEKNIGDEKDFWHDGVHFSHKTTEIMLNEVYKK